MKGKQNIRCTIYSKMGDKNMAYTYNLEMIKKYSTEEFEREYTYTGDDLGAIWSNERTTFKLWTPVADSVTLNLYKSGDYRCEDLINNYEMIKGEKGVWSIVIEGDIKNTYYTFTCEIDGGIEEFCDPYAKACGVNGKRAMVVDLQSCNPKDWNKDKNPNEDLPLCKSIIYELHTRDFSADKSSNIENRGKFLGLIEKNRTVNGKGQIKSGLDHLLELGITHIHLLPFYDYATVDESAEYDEKEYNWGYDPLNYNVPEGSYSTNPYDGNVRIKELKETILGLHNNGISVVMDVVYNHTYNEDFCFNKAVPGYFYRINENGELSNGSACGNDTASERSMVSKYIVDSVLYMAKEYHIDGFRFDLVGLLDVETINKIRKGLDEIRPNIMMYGEGWTLNTVLTKPNIMLATQKNVDKLNGFAMFSDNIRDAIKGSVFEKTEKGFISGNVEEYDELKKSVLGMPEWSSSPEQVVNYTSCHDNYTLFDKIHLCNEGISFEDAVKQNILAFSIVMLSQGIPLIHAGEEMLRTKTDENGIYVSDSVRSSDYVNSIKWSDLEKEKYYRVYEYYKGLIAFRKVHTAFSMSSKEEILENVEFIDVDSKNVIAYKLNEGNKKIIVIFNSSKEEIEVITGEDKLNCYVNEERAGLDIIEKCSGNVSVAGISCKVLISE
jgi:pullulanase